ncbi:ABC transporter family substrate-binding protein [Mobilicoccus pelagius]|uniref:Putative peptide ABC transporter substrate-binding protein n=1 Tax=Mobilicoccus pelagius NBRC 104925 TaxID=1089455 RepID=H5UU00_9MICO|nr:ABC transporter family substrate-binding protein [Mobilicoccus pelagius]GAB49208.1 putative peptide ABC transporter substrate-binding protein [Mobilicoccus pelagius NBRC 104925]
MTPRRRTITAVGALAGFLALGACAAPVDRAAAPTSPTTTSSPAGDAASAAPTPSPAPADLVADDPHPRADLARGGTLVLPLASLPANLNAFHVDGTVAPWREVTSATDPGLYRYSPEGKVLPRREYLTALPTVRRTADGTTITYRLDPRAVWNDGTPIDHRTFEATWRVHRAPVDKGGFNAVPTTAYAQISRVAPGKDPHEVVVTTRGHVHPVTDLFTRLVHPRLAEEGTFDTLMRDEPHPELRSGPWTIAALDRQAGTVTLEPSPRWWGDEPVLERIVFRSLEPSAALPAFRAGELDVVDVSHPAASAQIDGAPDLDLRHGPSLATTVLVLNSGSPVLADRRVRAAVRQGLDREQLLAVRFGGLGHTEKPADSALYQPFQPEARDNTPRNGGPGAARAALDAAGWTPGADGVRTKDGTPLALRFTLHGDDPLGVALAQTVQTQVRPLGVDVRIDTRPASAFGTTMANKDYDLLLAGGGSDTPSPVSAMCQTMCSTSPGNASGIGTPEIDARIAALPDIADDAARARAVNDVERDWLALDGQVPLWHGPALRATRAGLANLGPSGFAALTPRWEDVGWVEGSAAANR